MALPLLESMNRAVGSETITPPRRMVLICNALGLHGKSLVPQNAGQELRRHGIPQSLKKTSRRLHAVFRPFTPRSERKRAARHRNDLAFLRAQSRTGGFKNTISVDQFAATRLGNVTRFPSISLGSKTQESQSYTANGVMLPADNKPSRVFSKLFLTGSAREQKQQRQRLAQGRSILDLVADQTRSLNRRTSSHDRRQLNEYLAAIRRGGNGAHRN